MNGTLTSLLLAAWIAAIAAFSYANLADRRLWIPVFLALAGIFSSMLPLVITPKIALLTSAVILVGFIASLETLRPKRRRSRVIHHPW